jgi:hypothetical protein
MWICLPDSFLSVVKDRDCDDGLLVRARNAQHLRYAFPESPVVHTSSADYAFRTYVSKQDLTVLLSRRIHDLHYPNFKATVVDSDLHDLYLEFWFLHQRMQDRGLQG